MSNSGLFDNEEEAAGFSEIIPEQFIVTEKELDPAVYDQFMADLEWLDPQPDYAMLLRQGEELSSKALSLSQKKKILAQLAHWGTAEAYQLVQQYCKCCDPSLDPWSRVALYECQMRMESDLLDEPVGLISTGLGGDGQLLRYIFVLAFCGEAPAGEAQREIGEGLEKVCQQYRSVVEQAQFRQSCLYVQVLVPIDAAVGEVIEESLIRLNRVEKFFRQEYLVTNVSVPTDEEIQEFLGGLY